MNEKLRHVLEDLNLPSDQIDEIGEEMKKDVTKLKPFDEVNKAIEIANLEFIEKEMKGEQWRERAAIRAKIMSLKMEEDGVV